MTIFNDHLLQAREHLTIAAAELHNAWTDKPDADAGDDTAIQQIGNAVIDTVGQLDKLMRAQAVRIIYGGTI